MGCIECLAINLNAITLFRKPFFIPEKFQAADFLFYQKNKKVKIDIRTPQPTYSTKRESIVNNNAKMMDNSNNNACSFYQDTHF